MISKKIYDFLLQLSKNNNRDWFHANKPLFLTLKDEFIAFVALAISEIKKFDREIGFLSPKDCIFRIYRDVRFSKDKSPYKTNFGAFIVKGGRNSGNAGYYVHVEPGSSFLAGGIYMPLPDVLKKVRMEIYNNIDEFKALVNNNFFKETFGEIVGDKLKKGPKDFPQDFEDIDLLKFKSYTVIREVKDELMQSADFIQVMVKTFTVLKPLNQFLNYAIAL